MDEYFGVQLGESDIEVLKRHIDARFAELLAALPSAAEIAAQVVKQSRPRRLSSADEARLAALLPVVWKVIDEGRATFTVRQLEDRAKLSDAPALRLREALAAAGGNHLKVGKLLRRAAGLEVGIYLLEAHGRERAGKTYLLRRSATINRPDHRRGK